MRSVFTLLEHFAVIFYNVKIPGISARYSGNFLFFYKQSHCFRPYCFTELIYAACLFQTITCLQEMPPGHVQDWSPYRKHIQYGSHRRKGSSAVLSDGYHLSADPARSHPAFPSDHPDTFRTSPAMKSTIIQSVQRCIFSCSFYCILYDLHTNHFFCHRCKKLRDRTGSTVQVKYLHILWYSEYILVQYYTSTSAAREFGWKKENVLIRNFSPSSVS